MAARQLCKFQSNWKSTNPNLKASRLHAKSCDGTIVSLVNRGSGFMRWRFSDTVGGRFVCAHPMAVQCHTCHVCLSWIITDRTKYITCSAPRHYLNQCRPIVRYTNRHKHNDFLSGKLTCVGCKPVAIVVPKWIISSHPSAAYIRRWTRSSLIQVMACRLFGAKPLPEPMLEYC